MAIRSGIGIGEAQVFDTSGLANQYAKQVAADQANLQRQAIANQKRNDEFLKGLADSVSSTKLLGNGLHPEDVKQLTDYQNKTKELYAKASQATNPQERALLKADVDKSIEQQLEYVNGAKFFRQGIGKVTGRMFEHPDEYDDLSRESAKVLNSSSYINALGKGFGVIDDNTFKRRPDQAPLIKAFDDLDKTVKQGAGHDVKKITTENIGGGSFRYKKSIDPLIVLSNAIVKVKSDDGLKHLLKEQYKLANPTATTMPTDEELGNELVNIWKSKKQGQDPYSIFGEPQKVAKGGGGAGSGDDNPENYRLESNKVFISDPTYKGANIIKQGAPVIRFERFVPSPVTISFSVPQIDNVKNISLGINERLSSTSDLKMTGLGYSNGKLAATVVDKTGTEYVINDKDIPAAVKNGKQFKMALKSLGVSAAKPTKPTIPTNKPFDPNSFYNNYKKSKK